MNGIVIVLSLFFATIFLVQYLNAKRMQRNEDRAEWQQRLMDETMFRIREGDRRAGATEGK